MAQVRTAAESLIAILGDSVPAYADSLVRLRHRYLRVQLGAMAARARMLGGERLSFDQEARGALRRRRRPTTRDAHFDSLLARLDSLLPGRGPLATRYQRFRDRLNIPAAQVDTVFKTAIAACRARTLAHLALPPGERFDLEYVKGTSWNAYNWYKGGYHSLIQVNLDFPIAHRSRDRPRLPRGLSRAPRLQRAAGAGAGARARLGRDLDVSAVQPPVAHRRRERELRDRHGVSRRPSGWRSSGTRCSRWRGSTRRWRSGTRRCGRSWSGSTTRGTRWRAATSTASSTRRGAREAMQRYWLSSPEPAAKTRAVHRHLPQLRHQLQPGARPGGRLGGADGGGSEEGRWRAFGSLLRAPVLPRDLEPPAPTISSP